MMNHHARRSVLLCGAAALSAAIAAGTGVYVIAQGSSRPGGPSVDLYLGTWKWGNHSYDDEFTAYYEFQNNCDSGVVVTFDTRDVPFLTVMPRVNVKKGLTKIPVKLTTPKWPDLPACTDLNGILVIESTGYDTEQGVCHPSRRTDTVTAHVHWWDRPPPPPKLKVAGPDVCTVWWNTGQRPPNATDEQCLDPIRRLADAYRAWIDAASAGQPAEGWSWLPSRRQMASMSIDELLRMKQRADRQMGVTP